LPMILGVIVNPTFPENFHFIESYVRLQSTNNPIHGLNAEYESVPIWNLFQFIPVTVIGVVASMFHIIKSRNDSLTAFSIITIILFILTLKYARFVEYFHPFSFLVLSATLLPLISRKFYPYSFIFKICLLLLLFCSTITYFHYVITSDSMEKKSNLM